MTQTISPVDIRLLVRQRDGFCCTECGMSQEQHRILYRRSLDVHRLVPDGPYSHANCVTLCKRCHGGKSRVTNRPRPPRKPRLRKKNVQVIADRAWVAGVESLAAFSGMSRSSYIRMAVSKQMQSDIAAK